MAPVLGRYIISTATAVLMFATCTLAHAGMASKSEQVEMGIAIATDIHDNGTGGFRTRSVEIGPAMIEGPWALADWRSADGTENGQVLFRYICNNWNVWSVTAGAFGARKLAQRGVPSGKATALLADLSQLQHVAFTKVGPPGSTC
jgi:hypothetical protein